MRLFVLLPFVVFLPTVLFAQFKFERETRLKGEEVPASALAFLEPISLDQKVRWYYEENLEGNSLEAKFKMNQTKYSVEFDTLGQLQDIEIEVTPEQIDQELRRSINTQLAQQFSRYRWQKLQRQFSGSEQQLQDILHEGVPQEGVAVRYELELKGKNEEGTALYEITFDLAGQIIGQRQIIFKNANHLEY